uniref:NADH dehydrogenase subunit 2 n=1 Tax=Amaga expatria TaxID=2744267 RepID=A0A899L5S5_9PLAT|nr:NADH dehydrogenase subunit 2 [Amaga expatria]QSM34665.1 NADH dehydrogenase subunit 2 [Amaga expatria]
MLNFVYINNINKSANILMITILLSFSIFLLFTSISGLFFFFLLELNTFIMLYILYVQFHNSFFYNNISIICYFVISVISSIWLLLSLIFSNEIYFLFSMFVKLSLFPFLWWYPYISENINNFSFFVITIIQKFFPLIIISINNGILYDLIFINLIIISIFISIFNLFYNMNNIKVFLAWSSTINACWIILIFINSFLIGFSYWFCYGIIFSLLIISLNNNMIYWDQLGNVGGFRIFFSFICLCSFSGFPPFLGFYYKYLIFGSLEELNFNLSPSLIVSFSFSLFIFLNSIAYIYLLFKLNNLIKLNSFYNNSYFFFFFMVNYLILSLGLICI